MEAMIKQLIFSVTLIFICCVAMSAVVQGDTVELTAGVYKGAEPLYVIEERNGKPEVTGMNIEIIKAFVQKAPEFRITYMKGLSSARALDYLKDNTIQVIFGLGKNAEREAWFQYTDLPLYPVKFSLMARADDAEVHQIHTYEEMKRVGGTVLGVRASTAVRLFRERTKDLNIPVEVTVTVEQNLRKLLDHRGRYVVFNHYSLIDSARAIGVQDQVMLVPLVVQEASHWLAFSKAVPQKIVQKANSVLHELQESGELKSIYEKYGKLQ